MKFHAHGISVSCPENLNCMGMEGLSDYDRPDDLIYSPDKKR